MNVDVDTRSYSRTLEIVLLEFVGGICLRAFKAPQFRHEFVLEGLGPLLADCRRSKAVALRSLCVKITSATLQIGMKIDRSFEL